MLSRIMNRSRTKQKTFEPIQYQGDKIVIELPSLPEKVRQFIFAASLLLFILGLIGAYEFARILLGFGKSGEKLPTDLILTISLLFFSVCGFRLVIHPRVTVVFDPKLKRVELVKQYPFKVVQKRFAFHQMKPCEIYQDSDQSDLWFVKLSLSKRIRFNIAQQRVSDAVEAQTQAALWRDRINAMIDRRHPSHA